jgi:hypothetical protein
VATQLERWAEVVDLWNAGDVDAWFDAVGSRVLFSPDPRFPERGPFSGSELRTLLDQWVQAWGGSSELVLVDDPVERSGAVISRVRWDVSGATSGAHVPGEWAQFTFVAWFADDGSLDRLLAFFNHDEALAAADAGRQAAG